MPLGVFPSSLKLGNERLSMKMSLSEGTGLFWDSFCEKKLLERYLEIVALKRDLMLEDVKLLYFMGHADEIGDTKEVASILGIKRSKLMLSLQRLVNREILEVPGWKEDSPKLELRFGEKAEEVLADILEAKNSYEQIKYAGLSEEEIEQYDLLTEKIKGNIEKALK